MAFPAGAEAAALERTLVSARSCAGASRLPIQATGSAMARTVAAAIASRRRGGRRRIQAAIRLRPSPERIGISTYLYDSAAIPTAAPICSGTSTQRVHSRSSPGRVRAMIGQCHR